MSNHERVVGLSAKFLRGACLVVACLACDCTDAPAGDWPMWRHDARHSAASDQELAPRLHLQWRRDLPPARMAWLDQPKLQFDRIHEPIVVGDTWLVGSTVTDTLTAYSTRDGAVKWTFSAAAPLRLAPAAAGDKVYVACDDGYLYCLDLASGAVRWKFRGGPSERWILGNSRLVSTWPARGGPVVADGVVYFAASVWPFMGIFIHALDAETGSVIWTNDGDGSMYIKQPHNSDSFAGVAPQGSLAVAGERLLVPGGRSVPAVYNRRDGRFAYYHLAENGKRAGGVDVACLDDVFFNGGYAFELENGAALENVAWPLVVHERNLYGFDSFRGRISGFQLEKSAIREKVGRDRKGNETKKRELAAADAWHHEVKGVQELIRSGSRLYYAAENKVVALEPPAAAEDAPRESWRATVEGTPVRLLAADDRLLVATLEGSVYCFGAEKIEPRTWPIETAAPPRDAETTAQARRIIDATGVRDGYCIAWGLGTGKLVTELVAEANLSVIVSEPHIDVAPQAATVGPRASWTTAGWYGDRVSVCTGELTGGELPPYIASLIIAEGVDRDDLEKLSTPELRGVFESLRPFGGVACFQVPSTIDDPLAARLTAAGLSGFQVRRVDDLLLVVREGPLPGSADWTHEHADAANTRSSADQLVRAPLGLLWFGGGPSNQDVLPRHGHGPQPQVQGGRLFIEGPDMLRATDIYTGRLLWQRELEGVGHFYTNTAHQPGANSTGANYISTADGIYVAYDKVCLRLDPKSGDTLSEFRLPPAPVAPDAQSADVESPTWGYVNVAGEYLIAGANPLVLEADAQNRPKYGKNESLSSSKSLLVLNRHTGEVLWRAEAVNAFRHNAICAGGDRLYCIDLLADGERERLKRRGETPTTKSRLLVFDLKRGSPIWSTEEGVFGTWLSYSAEHDALVESGRPGRDTLSDEPRGMRAFRASDGTVLWRKEHSGPAMLHHGRILLAGAACDLLSGEPATRTDAQGGQSVPWTWTRNYGCNTPLAAEHLMTFRSGAAGYYDLAGDGGTGNFGGFRSGCTNNLIPAGGVLSAPDYTRTCVCGYQNQTSLAMVPMSGAEMWTTFSISETAPLLNFALNLGAPGDRRAADGRMWLNESSRAEIEFDGLGYYNRHESQLDNEPLAFVAASGCRGIRRLVVDPMLEGTEAPPLFTVRLYFCDPDNDHAGRRVFGVRLQGQDAIGALDVAAEAGGRNRVLVREFPGIELRKKLLVEFVPGEAENSDPAKATILNGIVIEREGSE